MSLPTCYRLALAAREVICLESARHFPSETGGILIGESKGVCIYITSATKAGPSAKHSLAGFIRDGDYSQTILDEKVSLSSGRDDYIGEWHSHPIASEPSPVDEAAMRWIANNKKYAVKRPVMVLCLPDRMGEWTLRVYIFSGRKLRELKPV